MTAKMEFGKWRSGRITLHRTGDRYTITSLDDQALTVIGFDLADLATVIHQAMVDRRGDTPSVTPRRLALPAVYVSTADAGSQGGFTARVEDYATYEVIGDAWDALENNAIGKAIVQASYKNRVMS